MKSSNQFCADVHCWQVHVTLPGQPQIELRGTPAEKEPLTNSEEPTHNSLSEICHCLGGLEDFLEGDYSPNGYQSPFLHLY